MTTSSRRPGTLVLLSGVLALFAAIQPRLALSSESLEERIDAIVHRPEFSHGFFGIKFVDLTTGKVLYERNADKLFTPASTTKLLTEGTLLARLGADFRFHTKVFRGGPLDSHGHLHGDLILVAAGDPNLSNRIQPDGTLAFQDDDHTEGGPAVPGDPLAVIKELALAVAASGIRRIDGRVLVDASLFPEGPRTDDPVLSPVMINDNVLDVVATPGANAGDAVVVATSPQTSYARFVNHLITAPAGTQADLSDPDIVTNADGTLTITLGGRLPAGAPPTYSSVAVASPPRFATVVFTEELTAAGVQVVPPRKPAPVDFKALAAQYSPDHLVAEHISPPLAEELKVTLKVSQNLHAGVGPYLLGALVAHDAVDPLRAGFQIERAFLAGAPVDLAGAAQGDGAGGDWADAFTPDFMCSYLTYWSRRPDFAVLFRSLPVLGKDGTLAKIQTESAGAGHVFAKTGTYDSEDRLNGKGFLSAKGLAGFVQTRSGRTLVFAAYLNHVALPPDPDAAQTLAGQALGAIAAAAYDADLGEHL